MVELEQNKSNEPHEDLIGEYLAVTLDAQTGSSEARFRQYLNEKALAPTRRSIVRLPDRFGPWALGVAGTALAASLGALWAGPSLQQVVPPHPGSAPQLRTTVVNHPLLIEQDVQSQTFDDGTYMLDNHTPVRVLRRRDLERTRWFDQDQKFQGEQVVPQDHVVYVKMKTY